jgi:hypothetical protein
MRHVMRAGVCVIAALLLTLAGVFGEHSVLAMLLWPGRVFDHLMHFEGGPPEEGVVYGLSFNILVIAGLLFLTWMVLKSALNGDE